MKVWHKSHNDRYWAIIKAKISQFRPINNRINIYYRSFGDIYKEEIKREKLVANYAPGERGN